MFGVSLYDWDQSSTDSKSVDASEQSKHLKGQLGPPVGNVTFFNHGGQLDPPVGYVMFFLIMEVNRILSGDGTCCRNLNI